MTSRTHAFVSRVRCLAGDITHANTTKTAQHLDSKGAGGKTRLESRIKKSKPHFVYRHKTQPETSRQQPGRHLPCNLPFESWGHTMTTMNIAVRAGGQTYWASSAAENGSSSTGHSHRTQSKWSNRAAQCRGVKPCARTRAPTKCYSVTVRMVGNSLTGRKKKRSEHTSLHANVNATFLPFYPAYTFPPRHLSPCPYAAQAQ